MLDLQEDASKTHLDEFPKDTEERVRTSKLVGAALLSREDLREPQCTQAQAVFEPSLGVRWLLGTHQGNLCGAG